MIMILMVVLCSFLMSDAQPKITSDTECPPEGNPSQCNTQVFPLDKCHQEICGSDKMCRQYHSISDNLIYHPYLKVRNVTHRTTNPTSQQIVYFDDTVSFSNDPYIKSNCMQRSKFSSLDLKFANESSFSPWEYVINRDENRIPRDILETKCNCHFCINADRTAYHSQYYTRPLKVTRYFHLKARGDTVYHAEFSYGCICEFDGGNLPPN